jgi:hypothetical protein
MIYMVLISVNHDREHVFMILAYFKKCKKKGMLVYLSICPKNKSREHTCNMHEMYFLYAVAKPGAALLLFPAPAAAETIRVSE